ncbi:MAG TPA: DNA-processing protein DprA, partial [Elusimicrobiales bacterium]|nr:DNA-processing protein DprA [Elusimicrobiales bacterium]
MSAETITDAEKAARLRLNAAACLKGDWALRLIELYGSAREALRVAPGDLAAEGGLTFTGAQRALREASAHDPEKELSRCSSLGITVVFDGTPEYPAALRDLPDRPLVLYMRGELKGGAPVGMVGTRLPTPYGRRMAARIAADLTGAGATVVSGLARGVVADGIDAA